MAEAPSRPLDKHLHKAWATTCAVLGLLLTVGAAFVLLTQVYGYFRTGSWHEVPVGVILLALPEAWRTWYADPTGLHSLLDAMLHWPLTLFLLIFGGVFLSIFGVIAESQR